MIKSSQSLIYSRAAAARIMRVPVEQIRRVEVWPRVVLVVPFAGHGLRARFVSKKTFLTHFAEWRRQSARDLLVMSQQRDEFLVRNPANGHEYRVHMTKRAATCGCEDYRNQIRYIGGGCCKHGYAVLQSLNYERLADYIADMS
jgi:hypothetical protein